MLKTLYFLLPAECDILPEANSPQAEFLHDRRGAAASPALPQASAELVDAAAFCDPARPFARRNAPVFVEYHPDLDAIRLQEFQSALAAHAPETQVILVTGDLDCAAALAAGPAPLAGIALKPCEAAGLGSTESAGVLFDNARRRLAETALPLVLWGGVATPEAAAAFLATGATAVVVEQAHWLTDDIPLAAPLRDKLRALKCEASSSVPAAPGLAWRFFDKGNSRAVRALRETAGEAQDGQPALEAARVVKLQARALAQSTLSADELVPLGADAPFAAGFAQRFGAATGPAIRRFSAETLRLWAEAPRTFKRFLRGPAVRELGSRLPVIQGAMSAISDIPLFARAVADAGALPTLAVGGRTQAQLDEDFGGLAQVMGARPYALNVLVLEENPNRDAQLAWIKAHRPPFVAVAAGDPAFAGALRKDGLEVIYLAADIALLRLALSAGVRFVVLEGCEAGGHVGRRTTLELAQEALMLRRAEPGLFRDARVALAGGVCDGPSALRAALLGADAVQLGTAYLATREIVETGALCPTYQQLILAAGCGSTRITGESVGLRVRALTTPKVQAISALERERAQGGLDETAFRKELEGLSLGSLYLAAKGRRKSGEALSAQECETEGQFMSGAVAANVNAPRTLAELHAELAAGADHVRHAPACVISGQSNQFGQPALRERIAVTGMALANSLGDDVATVVEASLAGKSGIGTVPKDRWDHTPYHTPGQAQQGTTYTDVGAFMQIDLPRKALGVSPQDYRTMSLSTKLTLLLARRAIEASGLAESLVPGSRVAVLTSQNSAEVASTMRGQLFNTYSSDIGEIAWRAAELTPEQRAAVERELVNEGQSIDDTTLIGRLNCTASGHVCNQFGFGGPSYSVGAACASSLIALYNAVLLIRAGVIDAAVVGGGEEFLTPAHYLEFSALRALAGVGNKLRTPAEHSRPFDRDRDGFVMGEGGAVVVLERESLARERGAEIHAFITGVGACTNHQGIVESVAESQMVALEAAYADAGYGLEQVDLVECHGTGTVQGDREEVRALGAMLTGQAEPAGTVLSSFKSQIGHTLGASGVSSLIRGIGAMRRGFFPPTNNFENPDPSMPLDEAGFRILRRAEPWAAPGQRGRRMQVNAFGFGGACVVVHVEAPGDVPDIPFTLPEKGNGAETPGVGYLTTSIDGRGYRLGLCGAGLSASSAAELVRSGLAEGATPSALARLARKGVFMEAVDEPDRPLALIFSGQGAFYAGMGREISAAYPAVEREISRLAACADYDLKALLFDAGEEKLRDTRWQQPALFAFEWALASQLLECGVRPSAVAGHSLGEFTALTVAGVLSPEDAFRVVDLRARCMTKAASLAEEPSAMAAVGLPVDILQWRLAKFPGVVITNYNTPKQVVVGGPEAAVRALVDEVKAKGHQATLLKVSMAFHSPLMRVIRDEFAQFLAGVEFKTPAIPVVSNVLKGPFPSEPEAIRAVMVEHLETPVHWTQNVYFLWSELGVRRFVEVGPDSVLGGLVRDIEPEAQTIRTAGREKEALAFGQALANLYAWGQVTPPEAPAALEIESRPAGSDRAAPAAKVPAAPLSDQQDVLERTIRIIMDATGYERSEIEPDMDLRQDLAIRSSRLPVIMDMAERSFGLTFRIEDFIGVHTVRQMAEQIEALSAGGQAASSTAGEAAGDPGGSQNAAGGDTANDAKNGAADGAGPLPVTRYEAGEKPLPEGQSLDLGDLSGKPAWVLGPAPAAQLTAMARVLAAARGFAPHTGPANAAPAEGGRPACLILALAEADIAPEDVDGLLLDAFRRLKEFIASPARKACVLVMRDAPHGSPRRVAFEGMLGMLLTLAQEYGSLSWRALRVAEGVDLTQAVAESLAAPGPVERLVRAAGVFTPQYAPVPLAEACAQGPALGKGDVVLVSAGAKGVTFRLLLALAPLGMHLALLGRSPAGEAEAAAVAELAALGASAEYIPCDVSEPADVARAVAQVAAAHGRVDGVIHGAGLLRDKFLSMMTEEDFLAVCRVKLGGLRNLAAAARPHGLRLAVAFSSVAAWQGNVGQGNYCCANRAMASALAGMDAAGFAAKVLWLPPVSGVGMADSQDIREMMELKGLGQAYVHIDELAPLAAREIACPEASGASVLIARHMPVTTTVEPLRLPVGAAEAGLALPVGRAPMLDSGRIAGFSPLRAGFARQISHQRDLWLPEHKPYKALAAPLFSAVMVVETFCEAARALLPHLTPVGVRNMRFLDMLPCPEGQTRDLAVRAVLAGTEGGLTLLDAELTSEEVSPKGRPLGRFATNFEGRVVMAGARAPLAPLPDFGAAGPLDPGSAAGPEAILAHYENLTAQTGRYRVIESVRGTAFDRISGIMRYRLSQDIAGTDAPLCSAPYLLEALMQLVLFHGLLRGGDSALGLLPVSLEDLRLARLCADGEALTLEARQREATPGMQLWDACGLDAEGLPVMQVRGLVMRALENPLAKPAG